MFRSKSPAKFYQKRNVCNSIKRVFRIFKRAKTLKDRYPHIVFDSNELSGTVVDHKYSPNGKYCAFTIDEGEPISYQIIVVDVEGGVIHGKTLQLTKSKQIAWSGDSLGFFVYVKLTTFNSSLIFKMFNS